MVKILIISEGKLELRLLKVKIPVGLKTPIHNHPSPMLIHITRGRLNHERGEEINLFKAGDAFIESNKGGAHYVKMLGIRRLYFIWELYQ